MKTLLHVCCGPCAEWPVTVLREGRDGFQGDGLVGYFFNPNIHPADEHSRRLENAVHLAGVRGLPLEVDPFFDESPFRARMEDPCVHGDGTASPRCRMCYALRMEATALKAVEIGADAFTTSLLVSPYQDHEAIIEIGREAGRRHGVLFLEADFRDGYREGQRMAREDGLYRQKYCGCIASLSQSGPVR
jgi:predicted adenine nucleotide alpha hydrolase (AANH) superfamily ATPase